VHEDRLVWWVSAADLTGLTYYFWSRSSPAAIWVELPGAGLAPGTPVRSLDPGQPGLAGGGVRPAAAGWAPLLSRLLSRSGPGELHRAGRPWRASPQ